MQTTQSTANCAYSLPKPDAWKRRDNSILLDVNTGNYRVHNRTRGRLRLYLGSFQDGDFFITVPTIKAVPFETDQMIREIVREAIVDLNYVRVELARRKLAR